MHGTLVPKGLSLIKDNRLGDKGQCYHAKQWYLHTEIYKFDKNFAC